MAINIALPNDYYDFPARNYRTETAALGGKAGVYILLDKDGLALYVGKAGNLRTRLRSHLSQRSHIVDIIPFVKSVRVYFVLSEYEREVYETYAIQTFQPSKNRAKVFFDRYGDDAQDVEDRLYEIMTRIRELEDERRFILQDIRDEEEDEHEDEDFRKFSQSLTYIELAAIDDEIRDLRKEREKLRNK